MWPPIFAGGTVNEKVGRKKGRNVIDTYSMVSMRLINCPAVLSIQSEYINNYKSKSCHGTLDKTLFWNLNVLFC